MKKRLRKNQPEETIVGVAWYRREQWARWVEVSEDRNDFEDTYDEWLAVVEQKLKVFHMPGVRFAKVAVDIEEVVAWCAAQGRPVNAETRAEFASVKMSELPEEEWSS